MSQNSAQTKEAESVTARPAVFADAAIFAAATVFFSVALILWWIFDHSYPLWDGAAHVKDSMAYARLIQHPHIFKAAWIKQFLTVNFDYPMTVHAINGAIKATIGFGRTSDMVALLLYQLILIFSVYKLSYTLIKDRLASALAIVFVSSYPLVALLAHVPLLDLGYLAFTALGLMGIAVFDKTPGWKQAGIMGIAIGLGATSKQISVLFLIGPCLYAPRARAQKQALAACGSTGAGRGFPGAGTAFVDRA